MTSPTPQANRFRFRVWHKKDKFMVYGNEEPWYYNFVILQNGDVMGSDCVDETGDGGNELDDDEFIIMQSTGLLDRNGKEIFEKDLLWNGMYYQDTGEKIVHTVEWRDGSYFAFTQMGKSQTSYPMMGCSVHEWKECEILGNLYETPNLLPKQ